MEDLRLTFIGTGNAFAPGGLCWNGFVANERVLFEAPPSALMALQKLAIDPNTLETVLLSHHHGDHFMGLPFLVLYWKYRGRTAPVTIVGPPETEAIARQMTERVYPSLFDVPFDIQWVEAAAGKAITLPGMRIEPVEVKHDVKLNLNLGYLCEMGGKRLGYTGDSAVCDGVFDLARASDVLVSECASRDEVNEIHMNLVHDMPKLRAAMRADANLVLTHLEPDVDSAGLPNTLRAEDLASYSFA